MINGSSKESARRETGVDDDGQEVKMLELIAKAAVVVGDCIVVIVGMSCRSLCLLGGRW